MNGNPRAIESFLPHRRRRMTSTFGVQGEEVNQLRATEVARQDSGDDAG